MSGDRTFTEGPLAGVRVLDLTAVLMGPVAIQLPGDMGADVIKVEPPRGDTSRGIGPIRSPYRTRDGHVCAVIYTDQHWRRFYQLTGREAAIDADERIHTITDRTRHMAALCQENARFFAVDTTDAWLERLRAADIPCTRLNDPARSRDDPQLAASGFFERSEHESEGGFWQMRQGVDSRGDERRIE